MDRRRFLASVAAGVGTALAGCSGLARPDGSGDGPPALTDTPTRVWDRNYGERGIDLATGVFETAAGGYVVSGIKRQTACALGLTGEGDPRWQRTYGGRQRSSALDLIPGPEGDALFTGRTDALGSPDAWLVRIGPDGASRWQRAYGGAGHDEGRAVIPAPDSGYLVAGQTDSFGTDTRAAWLVRTDVDGRKRWQRTYDLEGYATVEDVVATDRGGYVLLGARRATFSAPKRAWAMGVDADGRERWRRGFDRAGGAANAAVPTDGGGVLLAGWREAFAWFAELGPDGSVRWQRRQGSDAQSNERVGGEEATAIVPARDDGYLVVGVTSSIGAGKLDAWLLKIDAAGRKQWDRPYGTTRTDVSRALTTTSDGGVVFVGGTQVKLGPTSFSNSDKNLWVMKLGPD